MDFLQLIQLLQGGANPQQTIINALRAQASNNPMMGHLINMAQNGDTQGIETFARNITKERGVDFDIAFNDFRNRFHI